MVNVVCWFAGVSRPAREVGKGEGSLVGSRQLFAINRGASRRAGNARGGGRRDVRGVVSSVASRATCGRAYPTRISGGEGTTYPRRTPRRGWGSCPCCWCTRTRRRTRLRGTPWRGRCGCERGACRRSCERRDDFSESARARERFRAGRAVVRARRYARAEEGVERGEGFPLARRMSRCRQVSENDDDGARERPRGAATRARGRANETRRSRGRGVPLLSGRAARRVGVWRVVAR